MFEEVMDLVGPFLEKVAGWVGFGLDVHLSPDGQTRIVLHVYVDKSLVQDWTAWLGDLIQLVPARVVTHSTGRLRAAGGVNGQPRDLGVRSGSTIRLDTPNVVPEGTLGFFAGVDGLKFAVSANHVLYGNGHFPITQPVWIGRPGVTGGRGVVGNTVSGRSANTVDVARANLLTPIDQAPYGPLALPFDPVPVPFPSANSASLSVRMVGQPNKVGRTRVHSSSVFKIDYTNINRMGLGNDVEFKNQWFVEGTGGIFAEPGDSGGLVVANVNGVFQPLGMVIGIEDGDGTFAVVTPIQPILDFVGVGAKVIQG